MIFKCNKSRCSCYTLDAVIQINELGFSASKFIDVSNLDGVCFGDVVMKKFFMLLFGHFIDIIYFACEDKNVWWLFYSWNVLF